MGSGNMLGASEVASGSIHLTLQSILSTLIGIFGLAFLARTITQEEMGILTAITLVTMFVQLASDFGLTTSLAKYVSELKGRNEDISTHFFSALIFKIPASLLLCLALFFLSEHISLVLFGTTTLFRFVQLTAIDSFALALAPVFNSVLLGSGRMKRIAVCGVSSIAARWLSIVILVWSYGFYGAVIGWIIGDLTRLLLLAVSSMKLVSIKDDLLHRSVALLPRLLRFSWPLFMASIVTFLYTWYDRALVLVFLPLPDLGVYDMSYRAFSVLAALATALGQSLFPYYGMAYGRKAHKAVTSGIRTASRYTMMAVFPLTLGLFSTARPVITLFAGQQYEPGWTILAILSVFGLTYGLSPALGLSPTSSGLLLIYEKTKTVLLLSLVPVASSLASLPLLMVLGLNGLAVMRGASMLLTLLLTFHFLSKTVAITIDKRTFAKALVSSAVMAGVVSITQQLYYSRYLLPAYVIIGVAVYVAGMKALKVLNNRDMQLLEQTLGERAAKYIVRVLS